VTLVSRTLDHSFLVTVSNGVILRERYISQKGINKSALYSCSTSVSYSKHDYDGNAAYIAGGILDRVDSYVFTGALCYSFVRVALPSYGV
jgi:hypothetical protein